MVAAVVFRLWRLMIEHEEEALHLSGDDFHINAIRRFYNRDHVGCVE